MDINPDDYKSLNADVLHINEQLRRKYGVMVDSRPKYRVVWSNDLFEHRRHSLTHKVVYMEKYNYFSDRFVLERIFYGRLPELPESEKGIYEPVYVFQDANSNFLPPLLEVAEIYIDRLENPKPKMTPEKIEADERERRRKEVEFYYNYLQDTGRSATFYDNAGVALDSTKVKQ